jgi:hypothetical protein
MVRRQIKGRVSRLGLVATTGWREALHCYIRGTSPVPEITPWRSSLASKRRGKSPGVDAPIRRVMMILRSRKQGVVLLCTTEYLVERTCTTSQCRSCFSMKILRGVFCRSFSDKFWHSFLNWTLKNNFVIRLYFHECTADCGFVLFVSL